MNYLVVILLFLVLLTSSSLAQPANGVSKEGKSSSAATNSDVDLLAKAVFAAHGGDKLKKMKTLVIRGAVDVTSSAFPQAIAGGFATVISGSRYILDIQTPFQSLKQVFDGETTTSSLPGITLPPVTSLGFPMLPRLGDSGYVVSALPEAKRKQKGFRMTGPDGFFTDFLIDEKTNLIRAYESSYEFNGRSFSTSVEVDKNRIVDGITIPEKYSQRFDLGGISAYSSFKAKEILVNSEIDSAVFSTLK
ncbi:MAG: hypothetical protein JNJ39_12500 [Blastocatellia bacterium]|nr:hypothetical protein [Blastocatellia bacterium]